MNRFNSIGWLRETVSPTLLLTKLQIDEYLCVYCKEIPVYPISLVRCGHLICEDCLIEEHCEVDTCPSCNKRQNKARPIEFDYWTPSHRNFYTQIQVRCYNTRCSWIGSVCDWANHSIHECEYREVLCRLCLTRLSADKCTEHESSCTVEFPSF